MSATRGSNWATIKKRRLLLFPLIIASALLFLLPSFFVGQAAARNGYETLTSGVEVAGPWSGPFAGQGTNPCWNSITQKPPGYISFALLMSVTILYSVICIRGHCRVENSITASSTNSWANSSWNIWISPFCSMSSNKGPVLGIPGPAFESGCVGAVQAADFTISEPGLFGLGSWHTDNFIQMGVAACPDGTMWGGYATSGSSGYSVNWVELAIGVVKELAG